MLSTLLGGNGSIAEKRQKVATALSKLEMPIVVILDDIDRLSTEEIRDIFKLIRLTANFPNVIYLVAFDRKRVEEALSEEHLNGRAYLEKIIQYGFDLPTIPKLVLINQINDAINGALEPIPEEDRGPFNHDRWADIFFDVVHPLITSMRDIRRYIASVSGTVWSLKGEVALEDVLGLEAVRVFLPDVFIKIESCANVLTENSDICAPLNEFAKKQIAAMIEAGGNQHQSVVKAMIKRLFPMGNKYIGGNSFSVGFLSTWRRQRRVADTDHLLFYLERVAGQGLKSFRLAQQAYATMGSQKAFDGFLRAIGDSLVEDVIENLCGYEDEFPPEYVVPACTVLLNYMQQLPDRDRGMFSFDPDATLRRLIYRLIKSLKTAETVYKNVQDILPQVNTLYSKHELIVMIGYHEHAGHRLVDEEIAAQLEDRWRAEVRETDPAKLLLEPGLLWTLFFAKTEAKADEPQLDFPATPNFTLAILQSAVGESRSQIAGSYSVKRTKKLAWKSLIELFGGEEILIERIAEVKEHLGKGNEELLQLVDSCVEGKCVDGPRRIDQ